MRAISARMTNRRDIDWREIPFAEGWEDVEPDVVVWVDVAAFDAAWRDTDQWIGPGGIGGQDNRYATFGAWFAEGHPVHMCNVWVTDGEIGFTNGRHRFAWLRDHGVTAIPMQIGRDSADDFTCSIGTPLSESFVPG